MAALSPTLRSFLLRHQHHIRFRKFLIHTLTYSEKPSMVVRNEIITQLKQSTEPVEIDIRHSLSEPIRPDLQNLLNDEDVKRLNQSDKWIYDNNIPLVTESSDMFKLLLSFQNFSTFSDEDQAKADEFSKTARGCTNFEYYQFVIDQYFTNDLFEIINLYDENGKCYVADLTAARSDLKEGKITLCILSDNPGIRLMSEIDTVDLNPGDISNVKEKITTTVGRIIVNNLCFEGPFGDIFPFQNKTLNLEDDILKPINKALIQKKININHFKMSMDGAFYLGHFTELCTPCLDEHALTTDPNIKKRKAELLKQYEGQLDDPVIIAKIEDELIEMDKEYMKGDTALRFYATEDKAFPLWRKKLYIAVGGIEAFSKDSSKYNFLRNSLEEGVRIEDLSIYGNESRKGSYQRGHETQKGGYLTKEVIRAFHDSAITRADCGTKKGVKIDFNVVDPKKFIGRYILLQNKWVEITDDNVDTIQKKTYTMRSPMYCQCKDGYCYKCVGKFFEGLDVRQISMSIVDISNTFMSAAMKNMHGSKLAISELTSLDDFVL